MNSVVVDSSVWIEVLGGLKKAHLCLSAMKGLKIYIPTLVFYEVKKKLTQLASDELALSAIAHLSKYHVIELTRDVSMDAVDLALEYSLPMAEAIVLAHSRKLNAVLLTLDNEFSSIPYVKVVR